MHMHVCTYAHAHAHVVSSARGMRGRCVARRPPVNVKAHSFVRGHPVPVNVGVNVNAHASIRGCARAMWGAVRSPATCQVLLWLRGGTQDHNAELRRLRKFGARMAMRGVGMAFNAWLDAAAEQKRRQRYMRRWQSAGVGCAARASPRGSFAQVIRPTQAQPNPPAHQPILPSLHHPILPSLVMHMHHPIIPLDAARPHCLTAGAPSRRGSRCARRACGFVSSPAR